ncbi:MAG TPA: response regulator, partial [Candidatus Krumholzibacterium sp.]|nr:response regulator [Candidatus Krumholzibacterium sp.]
VTDTGHGMDEAVREHLFEPFFSTKGEEGTGLGLATVYGIVKQHDGHIRVYSEPDMGTTFKIFLPGAAGRSEKAAGKEDPIGYRGSETILLVEDDEQVRKLTFTLLDRQGYRVLVAKNGPEAISLAGDEKTHIDLLLTDVVMPGMNGRELFQRLETMKPGIRVLYMSGYSDEVIAHKGVLDDDVQFIQKPFNTQVLSARIRELLQ